MADVGDVVGAFPDAVIVWDRHKRVQAWLGAAPRLLGWDAGEVTGSHVDELLRPKDTNGNPCCIGPGDYRQVLRITKGMPEQELLVTTKRGAEIWLGVACTFQRDGAGRIVRTVAVGRNITRRKRIDLAKSEVISAVSHELRSPLTSVKGFTSTLLAKWDRFDEETKKHLLLTINTDADRVTRLIGELLDVSRIEAGRLQLRRQNVDLPTLAERITARIQHDTEHHQLSLDFPDGFPQVYADPDKVEQVLTNLLENAVKYTGAGAVTVSGSRDGEYVTVSVADQGEGIPVDQRVQVFSKFFRRGGGRPSGTGLGLYISKGLVEAHGGRIWVEEAPGGGAEFRFTLPTAESANGRRG
ncbi:MAG: ATP-binding protein [Actinomycetota bacterium]